jgi:hypothetical protein
MKDNILRRNDSRQATIRNRRKNVNQSALRERACIPTSRVQAASCTQLSCSRVMRHDMMVYQIRCHVSTRAKICSDTIRLRM